MFLLLSTGCRYDNKSCCFFVLLLLLFCRLFLLRRPLVVVFLLSSSSACCCCVVLVVAVSSSYCCHHRLVVVVVVVVASSSSCWLLRCRLVVVFIIVVLRLVVAAVAIVVAVSCIAALSIIGNWLITFARTRSWLLNHNRPNCTPPPSYSAKWRIFQLIQWVMLSPPTQLDREPLQLFVITFLLRLQDILAWLGRQQGPQIELRKACRTSLHISTLLLAHLIGNQSLSLIC